jgi:hypothetical protein
MNNPGFLKLDNMIALKWQSILEQPMAMQFVNSMMSKDRRVYALYLTQVYHYAFHTARNQALVAVNLHNRDIHYMQFCLEHALAETAKIILDLTEQIIHAVIGEYEKLIRGEQTSYSLVNSIGV